MLKFYWELGRDIVGMDADNKYGSGFYKCLSNDAIKAYYYVRQTVENAWSRAMLENFYDTNLFEREGSDLAQEMTRDP